MKFNVFPYNSKHTFLKSILNNFLTFVRISPCKFVDIVLNNLVFKIFVHGHRDDGACGLPAFIEVYTRKL